MNSYLDRLRQELEDATGHVGASDVARTPAGKWTPAQIMEHLFLTYQGTNRGLAKCLEKNTPLASSATLKDRIATFLVVHLGYFPEGRKAPERSTPRGMAPEEVRRALVPELLRMSAGLDDCEREFGSRTKILDHPILGPLTANEWRKFHWIHGRHHAHQIRQRIGKS
jgi:Protein of unknown function (DUF1569)